MSTEELLIEANYATREMSKRFLRLRKYTRLRDENGNSTFLYGKEGALDSYLRHSGLIRRVNEFRRVIVDVGHSHDHRDRSLLVGRLHRAAQLKNE